MMEVLECDTCRILNYIGHSFCHKCGRPYEQPTTITFSMPGGAVSIPVTKDAAEFHYIGPAVILSGTEDEAETNYPKHAVEKLRADLERAQGFVATLEAVTSLANARSNRLLADLKEVSAKLAAVRAERDELLTVQQENIRLHDMLAQRPAPTPPEQSLSHRPFRDFPGDRR